ncbi:MAG: SDR family NAD(P)-dependent oxidoreductase [Hyphomicrobiaceae bacterium]
MTATIVITGANRGIGLEMTRQAAARGDRVFALCRDPARMPALAGAVTVVAADVVDEASLAAAARAVDGPIDLLVCNAGMLEGRGGIDDPAFSAAGWQRSLMTNVAGPFLTVRAFHSGLKRAAAPRVAIIASVMGSTARANGAALSYRASKAAAVNLAVNLAKALAGDGIAVGAYHPGWVRTDMGGAGADIEASDSAAGLLARFDRLDMASSGVFEDYKGAAIPY